MLSHDRKRIGVFGGSFDPVHIGHLIIAQDAVEQLELDQLIFVPAAVSPFKQHAHPVDGRHRLEMLHLATEDNLKFEVSDLELVRGGVSYTVDTMEHLAGDHPDADLFFIVGLDSLVEMHRWVRVKDLFKTCTVVPFGRGGQDPSDIMEQSDLPDEWKKRLMERLIRIHEIEVSASEIRMRIAEGLSIQTLVPAPVAMYIAEHHLYM
jgi:nicotinate-nucleotide adenylyltransferase